MEKFNADWISKINDQPAPTVEGVKALLGTFTDGRQSYVLAGLLSFPNPEADAIVAAYEKLKGFDRDDLGEVIEEVISAKSREVKTQAPRIATPWGIA